MEKDLLLKAQKNEITEYNIYSKLAIKIKDSKNKKILKKIADDELKHYRILKSLTKKALKPNMLKVHFYILLSYIFGISFSLKLMEKGEKLATEVYGKIKIKPIKKLLTDEQTHEQNILKMLSDVRVEYAGSIVLGLNDALVELTGALAGLTFALRNAKIIAISGFITGFAAALSMGASEFLSSREEKKAESKKIPIKGAFYTGITYIITVIFLILPYILMNNVYSALATTVIIAILIIAFYTFYITTAKGISFWKRFLEMAAISLGVAIISFGIGMLLRVYLGIEV